MRPGDVALYRPHNALGAIVAWLTRARYCHVRLIVDEQGHTVEADLKGAIRGAVQPGDVIVTAPLTDAQRAAIPALAAGVAAFGLRFGWLADRGRPLRPAHLLPARRRRLAGRRVPRLHARD